MLENGFVLLHRSLLKWEWYDDIPTARLFVHLLLTVNYEKRRWQGIEVGRGQRVASLPRLSAETGLTVKQLRTALGRLKRTGEITQEAGPKYSLFTVCSYEKYQAGAVRDGPGSPPGQAAGSNETKEQEKKKKEGDAGEGGFLSALYQEWIGPLTPYIAAELSAWAQRLSPERVEQAVREAGARGAHSWRYVETILRRAGEKSGPAKAAGAGPATGQRRAGARSFFEIAQEVEDDLSGDSQDHGGAAGGFPQLLQPGGGPGRGGEDLGGGPGGHDLSGGAEGCDAGDPHQPLSPHRGGAAPGGGGRPL